MIKLEQAYIYGFGKWIDYEIKFPTNHFVCVVGNNETGKSTLQNFILFMLFGLPPRKREFYRPKTSGKMGGRLMINDADIGLYTIERVDEVHNGAARCFYNGKEYDEIWLEQRLNGLTAEIYNSIYSFSALDLVDITDMTDKDLGDILLGIGLTGSRNIHTIEKQLDQQIGALFKPYGKKPIINEQLQTVDELHTDLQKFKQNESTYEQKQSEITSLKNKLEQLQENLEKTNEQLFT